MVYRDRILAEDLRRGAGFLCISTGGINDVVKTTGNSPFLAAGGRTFNSSLESYRRPIEQ